MTRYSPNWDSLRTHTVPAWFDEAKVGIFIHWGLYSVPAFAPPVGELGTIPDTEWFVANPYAEWYFNSVNVGRGPTYKHHLKTYGADFPYERFADMWKAENWQPDAWADLFRRAGAKYVVLVTKHHDGFCLFPSRYTDYNSINRGPQRDIVGELTKSVREHDMRMGLYYSAIIDWRFRHDPMYTDLDTRQLNCPTHEYADYVYHQYMELIDSYHPSLLWNDIGWPYAGEYMLPHILSHYYNTCPEGVVNDRFNGLYSDYTVKEYEQGSMDRSAKWENTRGLGLSFGYNAVEDERHILSPQALVRELVDTVANNGNLLINVGPMADGTIPPLQEKSLLGMGRWLEENGEAIYGTSMSSRETLTDGECRVSFTEKDGNLYLIADAKAPGSIHVESVHGEIAPLAQTDGLQWNQTDGNLDLTFGHPLDYPVVLRVRGGSGQ